MGIPLGLLSTKSLFLAITAYFRVALEKNDEKHYNVSLRGQIKLEICPEWSLSLAIVSPEHPADHHGPISELPV